MDFKKRNIYRFRITVIVRLFLTLRKVRTFEQHYANSQTVDIELSSTMS